MTTSKKPSKQFTRTDIIEVKIEALQEDMMGVWGDIKTINTRLDGIDGRLDGIDGRLDGIDGRLDGIDGRLDGIDTKLERLDDIDSKLDKILDVTIDKQGKLNQRLTKLENHSAHPPIAYA